MENDKTRKIAILVAIFLSVVLLLSIVAIYLIKNNDTGIDSDNDKNSGTTSQTEDSGSENVQSKPTATPEPTAKPTPRPIVSLEGLSTTANSWWYGRKTGVVDGIDQYDYVLPEDLSALIHKYDGITGHGTGKVAYLTFDEGYENGFTPKILDVLKEKNVKAIFFVTGDFIDNEPELIKRMYEEGHILGNHTDKHPCLPEQTEERFKQELLTVEEKVNKVLGFEYDMRYYRPPEGKFSERDLALASNMGYKVVLWSFAHLDWNHPMEPSQELIDNTYKRITQSMHEQEVLLLHAVSSANTAALGDVIDYYQSQGYTFGTMDDI